MLKSLQAEMENKITPVVKSAEFFSPLVLEEAPNKSISSQNLKERFAFFLNTDRALPEPEQEQRKSQAKDRVLRSSSASPPPNGFSNRYKRQVGGRGLRVEGPLIHPLSPRHTGSPTIRVALTSWTLYTFARRCYGGYRLDTCLTRRLIMHRATQSLLPKNVLPAIPASRSLITSTTASCPAEAS